MAMGFQALSVLGHEFQWQLARWKTMPPECVCPIRRLPAHQPSMRYEDDSQEFVGGLDLPGAVDGGRHEDLAYP